MSKLQVNITLGFLELRLEVDPEADPGGNGGCPTVLTFNFNQGGQSIVEFWGTIEFTDFRRAIFLLSQELNGVLGPLSHNDEHGEVETTVEPGERVILSDYRFE